MSNRNLLLALLIVPLGASLIWLLLGRPGTGIDDADIFFVYARNFTDGHGLVYNVGGERVEGFTSMSWTLICAGFTAVFSAIEKPLLLLNILIGLGAVGACLKRVARPWFYVLLLAGAPAWFAWTQVTLMETGLWCLIITLLGLAVAERRNGAVAALLPLMLITRPESMLWGAWVILLVFARSGRGSRVRSALPALVAYVFTLAALIGFRMFYFGWPVPNTYYAKVSSSFSLNLYEGSRYLLGYVVSGGVALLALYALVRVLARRGGQREASIGLALFLLPGLGVPVLVGGDHFGAYRFYQPLWPLLCLIAANELPAFVKGVSPRIARAALAVLVGLSWLLFPLTARMRHEFQIAREGRDNGAALARMFSDLEALPTVAVITAGGNKLGYPGHVFDLMGLNDTEMAHAPGDAALYKNHTGFNRALFYRWNPGIVLCGESAEFDSLVLNHLHDEPEFLKRYLKFRLRRNGAERTAWYHRDLIEELGGAPAAELP